ncbi:mitofusin-2 [Lingula anatina]|uniref:Mitofusin-2 n=1 Tax=Lingula anatina TaxID=7574 RepID=A0A1S3JXL8_LINAN|nr:mitofusin-2 [Lingula anatina]|eukprot:XP_013414801.1 mitofusin-2 [Lingula anatina]
MSGIVDHSRYPMSKSPHTPPRQLGNGHGHTASPLKIFGHAKNKVNEIFKTITSYISESDAFLTGIPEGDNIVTREQLEEVKAFKGKVAGIGEVLSRDHMKVVFFGRTSNGKSTVINAMLKTKLLPSGIGHTTNCFVQVEGSDTHEGYLLTEDSDEQKSIHSVRELAHALSGVKLDSSALIKIKWPKEKCVLLRDDVVLVDSPGVDVSGDTDAWIDKFCLDADVFVLVANAESTLMQTEKNFFLRVSDKLSKPNIFILNNRWDASASEPEMMEEVRKQHLDRNIAFLVDELKVVNRQEAENRVFFISAREALTSRSQGQPGTPSPHAVLQEGYQARLFEFANFERTFEECLCKSAVKTKFEQHAQRGKTLSSQLRTIMEAVHEQSLQAKNRSITQRGETSSRLQFVSTQLDKLSSEIKDQIKLMVEDVENKVAKALNEEIRRLSSLVDEFDRPFHPDQNLLAVYKKELHAHVEQSLGRNLQAKCSEALLRAVDCTERDMTDRISHLLPEESKLQLLNSLPRRDFEIAYRLDCRNLCADFREDIEFHFSLGISSLVKRFLGPKGASRALRGYSNQVPPPLTPMTPMEPESYPVRQENELMMALLTNFSSLASRSTVGAVVVVGIAFRAVGWQVVGVGLALYGGVYLYERLAWTNKAKERTFKRQYVDYASNKLKLIVDLTSANCSHQVQQELSSTFSRLCSHVDHTKADLEEAIASYNREAVKYEEFGNKAKLLRNKAGYIDTELNSFIKQYLKHDV